MKVTETLRITPENQNNYKELRECADLIIYEGCNFPALQTSGNIYLSENAKGSFPALQTSGNIYLRANAKGSFPALQTSGYIDLSENAKGSFPALQTSGYIYLSENAKGSFPALQTSGYIDLRANAKGSFPALQTSGYIDLSENAILDHPKIKNLNYKSVDRTLFVIIDEKQTKGIKILTGYVVERIINNVIQKRNCFVAEKDGFFAHGDTVKKAIGDLNFKIVAEKLKNDPITENTQFTVMYYRTLTGACDSGCRSWMQQNGIQYKEVDGRTEELKPITAKELLPLLEKTRPYGFEKFKSLLAF